MSLKDRLYDWWEYDGGYEVAMIVLATLIIAMGFVALLVAPLR